MNIRILLGFGTNVLTAECWKILFHFHSDGSDNTRALVSWNKDIVVCLPHASFSSSWLL